MSDTLIRFLLLGSEKCGKTMWTDEYFARNADYPFSLSKKHNTTIGVDFATKMISHRGRNYRLQAWDTGGQKRFEPIVTTFLRGAFCAFLCFDVTNRESFEEGVPHYLKLITDKGYDPRNGSVYLILVGMKVDFDLVNASEEREKKTVSPSRTIRVPGSPKICFTNIQNKDDDDDDDDGDEPTVPKANKNLRAALTAGSSNDDNCNNNNIESEESTGPFVRQVLRHEAENYAEANGFICYCETSARSKFNIASPMEKLMNHIDNHGFPTGRQNIPVTTPPPIKTEEEEKDVEEDEKSKKEQKQKKPSGFGYFPNFSKLFSSLMAKKNDADQPFK